MKRRLQKLITNNKEKIKLIDTYQRNMKIIDEAFNAISEATGVNDIDEIDNGQHDNPAHRFGTGGSEFGFVDGSVRFLRFGKALAPVNLWGVTPLYRTNSIALTAPP